MRWGIAILSDKRPATSKEERRLLAASVEQRVEQVSKISATTINAGWHLYIYIYIYIKGYMIEGFVGRVKWIMVLLYYDIIVRVSWSSTGFSPNAREECLASKTNERLESRSFILCLNSVYSKYRLMFISCGICYPYFLDNYMHGNDSSSPTLISTRSAPHYFVMASRIRVQSISRVITILLCS